MFFMKFIAVNAGFVTMAVDDVGYNTSSAELDNEIHNPKSHDDGDLPRVVPIRTLAPGEEACGRDR